MVSVKNLFQRNFLSVFLKNSSSLKDSSFRKKPFSRRTFSFSRTCLYFGKVLPIKELSFFEEPSLSQNISSSFRKTLPKDYYSVKNFFFLKSLSFLKNSLFRKNSHFPKNSSVLKKLFVSEEPFLLLTSSLRNFQFHKNSFSPLWRTLPIWSILSLWKALRRQVVSCSKTTTCVIIAPVERSLKLFPQSTR